MKKNIFLLATICLFGFKADITNNSTGFNNTILCNQVGYFPNSIKKIIFTNYQGKCFLTDTLTGDTLLTKNTVLLGAWPHSGKEYSYADFSEFAGLGTYKLCTENNQQLPITISERPYQTIPYAVLKAFYYNRASIAIEEKYAGTFARPMGHADTNVLVHASAAYTNRPEGTVISSPKGWYDAGDYNKYIVNSAITANTLLMAYQFMPEYCQSMYLNIPETNNNIPDLIDEIKWNLDWMLSMQDSDGGVYHKLTVDRFEGFIMPHEAQKTRYVVQKTTAATLGFYTVMAKASYILKKFPELGVYADSCLSAANKAWGWANKNPEIYYQQPEGFNTGEYGDNNLWDEWFYAQVEYAITNNNPEAISPNTFTNKLFETPTWNNVQTMALISIIESDVLPGDIKNLALNKLTNFADTLVKKQSVSPMLTSLDYFNWGSNSDALNQGIIALYAFKHTEQIKYFELAQANANYVLGRNATGYCFVTGFGAISPKKIHHRVSIADSVEKPVPGMVIGGPNYVIKNGVEITPPRSTFPALSYIDDRDSYSTNETAINWNAPGFFLFAGLDFFLN